MTPVDPAKIKVGLYLPNGDGKMSPGIYRWNDVLRLAQKTEKTGLDSVWVADHMIFRLHGEPTEGRWECWQMLAAIAARGRTWDATPTHVTGPTAGPQIMLEFAT